jgi:hypothetical protein
VGLERGPLSLVSTTEELLGRESSGSGLENQDYGRRDPSRWPLGTLYAQKLVLTLPTSGGRSVGIVRLWTQQTELVLGWCDGEAPYQNSKLPNVPVLGLDMATFLIHITIYSGSIYEGRIAYTGQGKLRLSLRVRTLTTARHSINHTCTMLSRL